MLRNAGLLPPITSSKNRKAKNQMTSSKYLIKHTETFLVIILWALLISMPLIFSNTNNSFNLDDLSIFLQTIAPLFLIFLVNRFLLAPKLLLKGRATVYAALIIVMIAFLSVGLYFIDIQMHDRMPHYSSNFPPRTPPGTHPFGAPNQRPPQPPPLDLPKQLPPFANFIILSFLLVGFDTGLHAFFKLTQAEKDRSRLEKENVINQLDILRHQISPHFLMNTLNNIHTLIDISGDKAKEAVIKLSKLMRYLLYDIADNSTSLKNEISFIESYVELMKLRVSEKVIIQLNIPTEIPNQKIPPLLFTSFVENAFKHGISYKYPSFIKIDILPTSSALQVVVKNSNHQKKEVEQSSGIGLDNAKRRLDLLYSNEYTLNIIENKALFTVHLTIPFKTIS